MKEVLRVAVILGLCGAYDAVGNDFSVESISCVSDLAAELDMIQGTLHGNDGEDG
ncbi:MAG: hypothetical protein LBF84_02350 [Holosporales bacterium]|jgi:hypothetical protein|nr:hypothetical protein [Holosporales bacterium]